MGRKGADSYEGRGHRYRDGRIECFRFVWGKHMDMNVRAAFLAQRKKGIGGSDIATILNLNPWKTPYELWLDKTSQDIEELSADTEERMMWGNTLEDIVAKHYSSVTDNKVQRLNQQLVGSVSIAVANPDRFIVESGSRVRWDDKEQRVLGASKVLEVKTAHAMSLNSPDWGEAGTDEVPSNYWCQVQWYMGISGVHKADLAVLFGGQKFRIYHIDFDSEFFESAVNIAAKWWQDHVLTGIAPDPNTEAEARIKWRNSTQGKELIAGVDIADLIGQLNEVKAAIKELELDEQAIKDKIIPAFQDAETLTYMGSRIATYKQNKPSLKTDWKAAYNDLAPSPEHIEAWQTETPGARVLRLATNKD